MGKTKRTLFVSGILAFVMLFTAFVPPFSGFVATTIASDDESGQALNDNYSNVSRLDGDIYYSDEFFSQPSTVYNPHLATLSVFMADASCVFGSPQDSDDELKWYQSQPNRLKAFFEKIGFSDFHTNDDYLSATKFNTIGIGAAHKVISDDLTIIGICPRSGGYYTEWANNVWLGTGNNSDYMHEGWYNAAKKLIKFLDEYITLFNIRGNIKLWISGFSRGGATANIAAGLLNHDIDDAANNRYSFTHGATLTRDNLYAYTFEAPQGANINSKTVKSPRDEIYNNIFNIINPNDFVPKVAMAGWGFTRFGIDKFITTEFYNPTDHTSNREVFKKLYLKAHPLGNKKNDNGETVKQTWADVYTSDDLTMYGIPIENGISALTTLLNALSVLGGNFAAVGSLSSGVSSAIINDGYIEKDKRKANYDSNIVATLFLEELVSSIGSRQDYCDKYQDGVKNLLSVFADDHSFRKDALISDAFAVGVTALLINAVVTAFTGTTATSEIIDALVFFNSNEDLKNCKDMLAPLVKAVSKVYWERPNELITVALNIGNIFQNHDLDMVIAHVKAQDSLYIDAWNSDDGNISNQISLVPLMENADFARAKFFGYNDLGLRKGNLATGTRVVNIDGQVVGRSNILECQKGYAAGYYSYATEEKMELFFPIDMHYTITMKSYSIKLAHEVKYELFYQFISIDEHKVIRKQVGGDKTSKSVSFNSDRMIDEQTNPQHTVKFWMDYLTERGL